MEDKYQTIEEIEDRIEDLKAHVKMWLEASRTVGGGSNMAMMAMGEIQDLKLKKEDLINGTHKYEISLKDRELTRLRYLRDEANILRKILYSRQIKQKEQELESLKTK